MVNFTHYTFRAEGEHDPVQIMDYIKSERVRDEYFCYPVEIICEELGIDDYKEYNWPWHTRCMIQLSTAFPSVKFILGGKDSGCDYEWVSVYKHGREFTNFSTHVLIEPCVDFPTLEEITLTYLASNLHLVNFTVLGERSREKLALKIAETLVGKLSV